MKGRYWKCLRSIANLIFKIFYGILDMMSIAIPLHWVRGVQKYIFVQWRRCGDKEGVD